MAALSLAFDILARDNGASRTLNNVGDSAEKAGKKGERFGSLMKAGIGVAVGAIAGLGLANAFKSFIEEANEAAKVGRLTDAVVASTGGAAKVTAAQVSDLAEALSNKSAVDDELIQSGANVLLTFTKIRNETGKGNDVFDQATEAALNMSAALGTDMQAASVQIGKALNDPIKGVTALSKAGVSFTEQQKDQIKALTESGDVLGAQKIILSELETQFGGAAEAAASPLDRLKVVAGNLGEQIGTVLLPYVDKFATYVSDTVLPAVSGFIEEFENGEGAGGQFKDVLIGIKDTAVGLYEVLTGDLEGGLTRIGLDQDTIDKAVQIRDVLVEVGEYLADLWEHAKAAADILVTGLKPVWDELVGVWNDSLKPAFEELMTVLEDELGPIFGKTAEEQGPLLENLAEMTVSLVKWLLPSMVRGIEMFAIFVRAIADVVGPLKDAYVWSINLATQVRNIVVQVQLFVQKSVAAVSNLASVFRQKFLDIREGIANAMVYVISTVRGIPGQITGALGSLGGLLRNAGRNLIQGFINGIKEMIGTVRSTLSNLTSSLPDWKGPEMLDKVILRPAGEAVIDGFIGGLESRYGRVQRSLAGLTGDLGMPSGPSAGPGRPIVVQSYLDGQLVAESVNNRLGDMAERSVYA